MLAVSSSPRAPRIRVLPPEIADQIAAGEVVERPASVVKELAENALDAGARRIEIDVEGGGRRLIRVVDDGCGMSLDEARLALRRHATSKLAGLADLWNLSTMGFRGEALPSIAAVSRLALVTREPDALSGWRLEVEGGVLGDAREAGAPPGTRVEVRDLLWNVPARLKFLKSEPTEAAHITEAVTRLALAHPAVHFRLRGAGGRVALETPPHASLAERVRAVVGRQLGARLFSAEDEENGVRLRLFLAPPDEAQTTSRGIWFFVGRRFVRDRGLLHALSMGYGELIPAGRYAQAIVYLDPPEGTVDVNVHPQKVEVRFARPQEVFAALRHAVARTLARAPWLAERAGERPSPVSMSTMYAVASPAPPARLSDVAARYADRQEELLVGYTPRSAERSEAAPAPPRAGAGFFGSLAYVGQLDRTYLLCEAPGELVLIDQHAAHERIAYQRLREAHRQSGPRTQRLLFPRMLELEPAQAAAAVEHRTTLEAIGFDAEPFGGASFALRASPVELREDEVVPTLLELLTELAETDASRAAADRVDHMLATIACHSVVRAGDVLSAAEAEALLQAMDGVDFRANCPHGRPVLLRIGVAEIARRFGR
jgi:DNA mismatch repair protein MutL